MTTARRPATRSLRGALVCLAMFALGGVVLWGLFQAPRATSPTLPTYAWAAPATPVRFASVDFGGQQGISESLILELRRLDPDYVLVQNIRFDDVSVLAEAIGMAKSYHPALFQRPDPRAKGQPGDLLLSRHRLYDAKPLLLDPDPAKVHMRGVEAVADAGGSCFVVASGVGATDESLKALDASRKTFSPPIVLGTGFVRAARGEGLHRSALGPTVTLSQEVEQGGPVVPVSTVYADPGWVMVKGDVRTGAHPMILYVELKAWTPSAAAATRPWR